MESNSHFDVFALVRSVISQNYLHHFLDQSDVKPKPIVTCSHAFSRASHQIRVFASSSDWIIVSRTFFCDC